MLCCNFTSLLTNHITLKLKECLVVNYTDELYIVGGAVRDACQNINPRDLDFSTNLSVKAIEERLTRANYRIFNFKLLSGTVFTVIDGERVEITTLRGDSIIEDLKKRDFTINAMAVNCLTGQFFDPCLGCQDLENNVLKCCGNPLERFVEDPHRMIRLGRLGPASGRLVDLPTLAALQKVSHLLSTVAIERLRVEFVKIIESKYARESFLFLRDNKLLEHLLPEIMPCVGFEQNHYHCYDVFEHILDVTSLCDPALGYARVAALFHDIGKPQALKIEEGVRKFIGHEIISSAICKKALTRLKFPTYYIDIVSKLVSLHMKNIQMSKKKLRRLMLDLDLLYFEDWLELKKADLFSKRAINVCYELEWNQFLEKINSIYKEDFSTNKFSQLAISGKTLLELGMKEGPEIGQMLHKLQERILEDPKLNEQGILKKMVIEMLASYNSLE